MAASVARHPWGARMYNLDSGSHRHANIPSVDPILVAAAAAVCVA